MHLLYCFRTLITTNTPPQHRDQNTNHNKDMDLNIKGFDTNQHTVEVGADDTVEGLRRKVASAMGLLEDGFCMSFGDEALGEGADMTQLSAGDTIILTKTQKYEAIAELHALGETDLTAERLESVRDPEVACLLLQAEVATVIPNRFLARTSLTRLDLSVESIVTHIGDSFLAECTSLTSVDLSGLIHVTQVGANLFFNCINLTTLDISALSNVTQVGGGFLQHCSGLTTLDLSALSNVTSIMSYFLSACNSLTTLDISALSNVTQVGACFLQECSSLKTLDLSPLSNVTSIMSYFLFGCNSLTTLYLSPLSNVRLVGPYFLAKCSSLTTLDLAPLSNLTHISNGVLGTNFVVNCTSLTSIYLSGCSSVVSNEVRKHEDLRKIVVEARPKRSRDESPEQSQKRRRHAQ